MTSYNSLVQVLSGFRRGTSMASPEDNEALLLSTALKQDTLIKKYNKFPEEKINELYSEAQRVSKDSLSPIIYLNIDEKIQKEYDKDDQSNFYKSIVRQVLDATKDSRISQTTAYSELSDWNENDFSRLYQSRNNMELEAPIMEGLENIGSNISNLLNYLNTDEINLIPLLNIGFAPAYEEGAVSAHEPNGNDVTLFGPRDVEKKIQDAVRIGNDFLIGSYRNRPRTLSTPGWGVDLQEYSWNNQRWNISGFAEGAIFDEIKFMQKIQL